MAVHTVTDGADTFTCNAYLVTGERTALVDAGTYDGIVEAIREHADALDVLVLTHQHGDHVGELESVLDAFGADLAAYDSHSRRTDELEDGNTIQLGDEAFDVVHTPGHADDHVAFVSETTLFSGDVVVHDDGAFDDGSFGRTDYPGQDREVLIDSIERLIERTPESVRHMYSGHGGTFEGDVHAVLERALERAKRREPKYPDEN